MLTYCSFHVRLNEFTKYSTFFQFNSPSENSQKTKKYFCRMKGGREKERGERKERRKVRRSGGRKEERRRRERNGVKKENLVIRNNTNDENTSGNV